MTNEQIISNQSIELMKQGKIRGTGRVMQFDDGNGGKIEIEEPEAIHTFAGWKGMGFKVKKGEHAVASFPIWKHTQKDKAPEELTGNAIADAPIVKMFMKNSFWFTAAQVEKA